MCGLIKKMFMKLITSIGSASGHTKSASLSNQKCMTQPTLTNLYPNEYSQELHYHPFDVNFNRYVRSIYFKQVGRFRSKRVKHE